MPLVWGHGEYIKLLRSLNDGVVFDMPPHTVRRYVKGKQQARCRPWRPDCPVASIPAGRALRLDLPQASVVRYTRDGWSTQADIATVDTGVGLSVAEISTKGMTAGESVVFTWRDAATGVWLGCNHQVAIVPQGSR
jgi:glucoamylase